MWKLKFNLKAYLSTATLPGQTTKMALTEEFMFQNVAYRPTVSITGVRTLQCKIFFKKIIFAHENMKKQSSKVAHNSQPAICFYYQPGCPKGLFQAEIGIL